MVQQVLGTSPLPWVEQLGLTIVLPENALICLHCRSALPTGGARVLRHLREVHGAQIPECSLYASQLDCLHLLDASKMGPRADGSPVSEVLEKTPGYVCLHCRERTSSRQVLSRHLPSCCGIAWKRAVGDRDFRNVYLQRWVGQGPNLGRWWIVSSEVPNPSSQALYFDTSRRRQGRQQVRRIASDSILRRGLEAAATKPHVPQLLGRVLEGERQKRLMPSPESWNQTPQGVDPSLMNMWLERTRWKTMYALLAPATLTELVRLPNRQSCIFGLRCHPVGQRGLDSAAVDECKIAHVLRLVDHVFDRCEETHRHTSRPTLCWLRSGRHGEPYHHPFQLVAHTSSKHKYRSRWKQGIAAMLRDIRQTLLGNSEETFLPLTSEQKAIIQQIWRLADSQNQVFSSEATSSQEPEPDEFEYGNEHSEDDESEFSDTESDDEAYRAPQNTEQNMEQNMTTDAAWSSGCSDAASEKSLSTDLDQRLTELLFQLSVSLIVHEFGDGQPASSTLIFLSGIFGFTPDGVTYQRPRNFTPIISALIYCSRLLFLEYVLPLHGYAYLKWPARPCQGRLDRLNKARRQYLCFGCESPFGELSSLLSYGRQLLRSDGPAFFVRWSDDGQTLSFAEHRLQLSQFRAYVHHVRAQTTELCRDLMQGWRPHFNLHNMRDHFTNRSPGYSFVTEPSNGLADVYTHLLTRLCTLGPRPLMHHDTWDVSAALDLLQRHEKLVVSIWLLFYLDAGQVPRLVDLSSLEVRNSHVNLRGVFIYNNRLMYLIRSNKARRSTNHEFYVAGFPSPGCNADLFYYLVYIRPCVEAVLRHCFGLTENNTLIFATNPVMAKQSFYRNWKSPEMSHALRKSSQPFLDFRLNGRLCRQLTIAMTEKHIKAAMHFDRHNDRGRHAEIEAVFAWQSGHRPVQRGTNYGLDGAFPHQLQPALLRPYEHVSDEWHWFIDLQNSDLRTPPIESDRSQSTLAGKSYDPIHPKRPPLAEIDSYDRNARVPGLVNRNACAAVSASAIYQKHSVGQRGKENTFEPFLVTNTVPTPQPDSTGQSGDSHVKKPLKIPSQWSFDDIFVHLPQYRVIVCHLCQVPRGVPPSTVNTHLKRHHPLVGIRARQKIGKKIKQLSNLAWHYRDVVFPHPWEEPVEGLPVYDHALRCLGFNSNGEACRKIVRTIGNMQQHCKEAHGWTNQQQRGGDTRSKLKETPNRLWQDGQLCQQLFKTGGWQDFFQIRSKATNCAVVPD